MTLQERLSKLNSGQCRYSSTDRDQAVTALLSDFPDFGNRGSLYQPGGAIDHRQAARERLRRTRPLCWTCIRQVWDFQIDEDGIPTCIDCRARKAAGSPTARPVPLLNGAQEAAGWTLLDAANALRRQGDTERAEIYEFWALKGGN